MPDGSLSVDELKAGLLRAGDYLTTNYRILDNLNVFPVPDGDTGTNMLMTYRAGIQQLSAARTIAEVADHMNDAMTRHSRGNSGFILARFFHGFFEVAAACKALGVRELRDSFASGSYRVNTSLFSPVEGTMITVIAAVAEALARADAHDLLTALDSGVEAGRASLFETPRLLKILAKAGVVDSGALGFLFLLEGFRRGLADEDVLTEDEGQYRFSPDPSAIAAVEETEQMHRYCTEVLVRRNPTNSARSTDDAGALGRLLRASGSSIAVVTDDDMIKVHIHTDEPDSVIRRLRDYGTVATKKIEDMREQMGLFAEEEDPGSVNVLIACVPGEGFRDLFVSLGVADCMVYGSTLPTTADILEAVEELASLNVTILPNNRNILPSAMLARDRSPRNISILPTENVIQGLSAIYGYSENATMAENLRNMADCIPLVQSISLYRSNEDTVFDRTKIAAGGFFAVHDGHILSVGPDPTDTSLTALNSLGLNDRTNVCIYHGTPEAAVGAQRLLERTVRDHPAVEVEVLAGGQPREFLIISVE